MEPITVQWRVVWRKAGDIYVEYTPSNLGLEDVAMHGATLALDNMPPDVIATSYAPTARDALVEVINTLGIGTFI